MDEVDKLIKDLKDEHWEIRFYAAEALIKIGKPAVKPLIEALKDKNRFVHSYAANALGKIGDNGAVPALIKTLKDENWYVRSSAAAALGEIISSRRSIKELEEIEIQLKTQKLDRYSANYGDIKNKVSAVLQALNKRKSELLSAQVAELKVEAKQFPLPKAHGTRSVYRLTR